MFGFRTRCEEITGKSSGAMIVEVLEMSVIDMAEQQIFRVPGHSLDGVAL